MTGTRTGGLKAAAKNLERDPDFYKKIGRKGGTQGHTGGFAANPELARIAGSKGGKKSRRGPSKKDELGRAINKDGTLHGANGSHMRVRAVDFSDDALIAKETPLTFEEQKIQRRNLFRKFFGRNK